MLKWAGGKRQLLPQLRRFYPRAFNRYIEPFFGSGAVFFDLHGAGRLRGHDVVLIDSNADLIGCYETVRDAPDEVAGALGRLAAAHARGGARALLRGARRAVQSAPRSAAAQPTAASPTRRRSRRC